MVELPNGKMKSREGTVVDADELMEEMYLTAKEKAQELGKMESLTEEEKEKSYETVGLGALKYYILKIDPKKKYYLTRLKVLISMVIQDHLFNILMHESIIAEQSRI
jgi:arginyl-tRNA synthetase